QHLQDNVLYNVRIRGVIDGVELPFGPACRVTLDPVAAACTPTGLNDITGHPNFSCGVSRTWGGPNSMANRVYARSVGGANKYEFEFSNANEGYLAVLQSNTVIRHLNWSSQPALNVGSTYTVRVRASKDGGATWCSWGWACEVTIAPGVAPDGQSFAALDGTDVGLWPNPNNGQQFWFTIASQGEEAPGRTVAIDIHDLSGKRIMARQMPVQHGPVQVDLDGDLASGTYLVVFTVGTDRFVKRMVISD
ncbi:MAG: T9SS type A sorting domain-containing protein, partial [Flavobacteriales bacterium]|nr:T9SS type A sorting domain-containing protein [Flavobacteriales bacterium]